MKTLRTLLSVLALTVSATSVFAQQQSGATTMQSTDAKNIQRIQKEVRHELVMLPYYSIFDWLQFRVSADGTVMLEGFTRNPALKKDAERAIKDIEGVETVTNNIEVTNPSSTDDRLALEAARRLFNTAGLFRYMTGVNPSIHIVSARGRLILLGVVDSQTDKQLAENAVTGLIGSFPWITG